MPVRILMASVDYQAELAHHFHVYHNHRIITNSVDSVDSGNNQPSSWHCLPPYSMAVHHRSRSLPLSHRLKNPIRV